MTASRDPDRLIRAFLDEGLTELPDRAYDAVRADIDRTRQRVVIGPWREPRMNNIAKLAIAAAAVVAVAVVGINLMPSGGGTVGTGSPSPSSRPSPSPSASPSPPPQPSPSPWPSLPPEPTPQAGAFPAEGRLATERYTFSQSGIPFSLEVTTPDWISSGVMVAPDGGTLTKNEATPQKVWMLLWSIDGVYADPCGQVPAPPVSPSAADLAAAVASIPGYDVVTPPTDVTVGGLPAKHVAVKLREDIGCSPSQFFMWYDNVRCGSAAPCHRWANAPGRQINDVWIVEVDGKHIWIEAETFDTATAETVQEVQQMINSVQFE